MNILKFLITITTIFQKDSTRPPLPSLYASALFLLQICCEPSHMELLYIYFYFVLDIFVFLDWSLSDSWFDLSLVWDKCANTVFVYVFSHEDSTTHDALWMNALSQVPHSSPTGSWWFLSSRQ